MGRGDAPICRRAISYGCKRHPFNSTEFALSICLRSIYFPALQDDKVPSVVLMFCNLALYGASKYNISIILGQLYEQGKYIFDIILPRNSLQEIFANTFMTRRYSFTTSANTTSTLYGQMKRFLLSFWAPKFRWAKVIFLIGGIRAANTDLANCYPCMCRCSRKIPSSFRAIGKPAIPRD